MGNLDYRFKSVLRRFYEKGIKMGAGNALFTRAALKTGINVVIEVLRRLYPTSIKTVAKLPVFN